MPKQRTRRLLTPLMAALALCGGSVAAWGQSAWPTRPISLVVPFAAGGPTDITNLGLACGGDNRKESPTGYHTRRRATDNRVEWVPPPHLDTGQPRVNNYHHPENLLLPPEPDDSG